MEFGLEALPQTFQYTRQAAPVPECRNKTKNEKNRKEREKKRENEGEKKDLKRFKKNIKKHQKRPKNETKITLFFTVDLGTGAACLVY